MTDRQWVFIREKIAPMPVDIFEVVARSHSALFAVGKYQARPFMTILVSICPKLQSALLYRPIWLGSNTL